MRGRFAVGSSGLLLALCLANACGGGEFSSGDGASGGAAGSGLSAGGSGVSAGGTDAAGGSTQGTGGNAGGAAGKGGSGTAGHHAGGSESHGGATQGLGGTGPGTGGMSAAGGSGGTSAGGAPAGGAPQGQGGAPQGGAPQGQGGAAQGQGGALQGQGGDAAVGVGGTSAGQGGTATGGTGVGVGGASTGGSGTACPFDACHIQNHVPPPSCGACTDAVCASHPSCCNDNWDATCALAARGHQECGCAALDCSKIASQSANGACAESIGTCNAVTQKGCNDSAPPQQCELNVDTGQEQAFCNPVGVVPACGSCNPTTALTCGVGLSCVLGTCLRTCCEASDCGAGTCDHNLVAQNAPIGVCVAP